MPLSPARVALLGACLCVVSCEGLTGPLPGESRDGGSSGDAGTRAGGGSATGAGTSAGGGDATGGGTGSTGGGDTATGGGNSTGGGSSAGGGTASDGGPGLSSRPTNTTCLAVAKPVVPSGVALARAFKNLTFTAPVELLQAPGDAARVFVGERPGTLKVFPYQDGVTAGQVSVALNLTAKVDQSGEGGMLGVAFPPDFATNKVVYVSYTETGPGSGPSPSGSIPLRSVVSRFRSADDGATFEVTSEEVLFKLDQPYTNHKGGNLAFGPDGYLYIGFGDGGSGGDPHGNGQNRATLLGKMLRIDVSVPYAQRYAIPPTNPYPNEPACNRADSGMYAPDASTRCGEIFAYGLRNPWRWSFDSATGELWVGDVGQNAYEEVDKVELGGNYGWSVREGYHCYGAATCDAGAFLDPVVEYDHSLGVAVTGGFVYRGTGMPGQVGKYFFTDYGSGRVWTIGYDPVTNKGAIQELLNSGKNLASMGQTLDGEVYALDISGGTVNKLVAATDAGVSTFPQRLTQTGCFDPLDARARLPALIPYELNSPLWSDGAQKERAFAIPDGTTITVGADGDFQLPIGSVVFKTFSLAGARVETRMLMHHADDTWAGYTYEWNDAGTDAVLLPAGQTRSIAGQSWTWPSRDQCLECHTSQVGRTIGLEAAQLNRTFTYPSTGVTANQLTTLEAIGLFSAPLGAAASLALEPPSGSGALELRARAYLHSNCSMCHRNGMGQGPQDFRASLTFKQMNVCNVAPTQGDLGIAGAKLLVPGQPATSLISARMHTPGAPRMPPLGTVVIDPTGTALIDAWVSSVSACPP